LTSIFRSNFFGDGPRPDIATSTFSYDAGNRLTEIAYTYNGGPAIDAYSWTYDAANRVTSMTTTTDGTATYSYDNTNQVTGAGYTGNGQPANESYSYDSNGNRTNTGYATGTNNLLTSDGTFNYAYDAEGDRTSRTRISNNPANDYLTTYAWDYRDRLTDVDFYNNSSVLTSHVHYTYDVFDHRISKSLDATGSGSYSRIEYYVYDGNDVALDFVDPDGAGPLSVALATRYLNGPGNAGATDQVFAQEDASTGNVLWLLADNLGTTRDVVDNSSTLAAHYVYNSFGQLVSGPTNVTSYLYAGQMWDADVGLQYNWHRWYDPAAGRWISQDPSGFRAGDPNLSRYVGNRATSDVDAAGLAAEELIAQEELAMAQAQAQAQQQQQKKKLFQGLILQKIDQGAKKLAESTITFVKNIGSGNNFPKVKEWTAEGLSRLGERITAISEWVGDFKRMGAQLNIQIGILSNLKDDVAGFVSGYFNGEKSLEEDWEKLREFMEDFSDSSQKNGK